MYLCSTRPPSITLMLEVSKKKEKKIESMKKRKLILLFDPHL